MKEYLQTLLKAAESRLSAAQLDVDRVTARIASLPSVRASRVFNAAYQRLMPARMQPPPIPSYNIPGARQCDIAVKAEGGQVVMIDPATGASFPATTAHPLAEAYKIVASQRTPSMENPVKIALFGDGGTAWLGCSDSVHNRDGDNMVPGDIFLQIAGQGTNSKVDLKFGGSNRHGYLHMLHAFNVGLYSGPASFTISANDGCGEVIFDGHWAEPSETGKASFLHIDQYQTLVLRNMRWRGTLYREHSGAYIKSCVGDPSNARHGTWLVGNEMQGGNRTGFHIRPAAGDSNIWGSGPELFPPTCPLVIADNLSEGYGWEHAGADGGGALTVWSSPDQPVYVFGNRIIDARYSCLVAAAQGWVPENALGTHPAYNRDWLNSDGYVIKALHVFDNRFENDRSPRSTVSINGVEDLFLYEQAHRPIRVTLDNAWAVNRHDVRNGTIHVEDASGFDLWIGVEDPGGAGDRRMTPEEIAGFVRI